MGKLLHQKFKDEHHFWGGDISIVVLIHGKQQSDANGLGACP